jgi:transcriptional regulator with XRE-family HTH domain
MVNIALLLYWQNGNLQMINPHGLYLVMEYIDFYDRVKSLVKAKKTTIEYVVGEAGLSLASYNAYRRHENLPRADEALKIAQVLETTVEYLLTGEVPEPSAAEKTLVELQATINEYFKKPDKKKHT